MIEFDEDTDEEWGEYDGQCLACDLWGRIDDLGLCELCRTKLEPGDLVFYAVGGPSGTVSHVGLYVGDGMAIATYDGQNVMVRPYDDPTYPKEFWGARRYW